MQIEPAALADIPALCQLLKQLFEQEAEFTPDLEAQRRGLQMILTDGATGMILVARDGGQIVGMVNLLYTVSTALGARVALLEDMVIAPHSRNCGLGTRLLDAAVRYAKLNGCRRITLLTDADNLSAQRFYQRQGFCLSPMIPLRLSLS